MRLAFAFILILTSCSTNKEVLVTKQFVINDTIVLPSIHHHIYDSVNDRNECLYVKEFKVNLIDTFYLEYYVNKKEWRNQTKTKSKY